jgi:hypothetical protein
MDRWGCPFEGLPISEAPNILAWISPPSRRARYYGPMKYCEGTQNAVLLESGTPESGALGVLVILGKDCTVDLAIVEIMPILAFTESVS